MNCRKAERLLPLAAGGDLPPGKAGQLESHLKNCAGCRGEFQAYRAALEEMKSLARAEPRADWPEAEWRAALELAAGQRRGRTGPAARRFPGRLAWTMGSAAVVMLAVGSVLFLRNRAAREISEVPATSAEVASQEPIASSGIRPVFPSRPAQKSAAARPQLMPRRPPEAGESAFGSGRPAGVETAPRRAQDVLNMVIVSPESGLTVHWVFNNEFELKEK